MDSEVETIAINDEWRVVVFYDGDATNPRKDWDMVTGALTVRRSTQRIDVEPVHDFPGDLQRAYDQLADEEEVVRWARIFHGITLIERDGTFWWCDPTDFAANWRPMADDFIEQAVRRDDGTYGSVPVPKVEQERLVIAQEQATYDQWAEGNVYGVVLQKCRQYLDREKLAANGGIDDGQESDLLQWEDHESLWGCYLDDEYTALHVALELAPAELDEKIKELIG